MSQQPNFTDRLKRAWRYVFSTKAKEARAPYFFPAWRTGQVQWTMDDIAAYIKDGYSLNSIVYAAVMYKVRAARIAPLRAYTGDYDNPTLLPANNPLTQITARPNQFMSWHKYYDLCIGYSNVTGNAYTVMSRPQSGGLPSAMYSLRPDRVFIIPQPSGIKGYLYVPEGKAALDGVPILPQDMMHFKFPNLDDPLEGLGYGMSPLKAAARSIEVDNRLTEFTKDFFDHGAVLYSLLKYDVPLDNETVTNIRERWDELYGGSENWGKVGVLDQGGDYQRIGLTFEEFGFDSLEQQIAFRLLSVLGVPPILVGTPYGLDRSTYQNFANARAQFWEDVLIPDNMLFEDDLRYLLSTPEGEFVAFDYSKVPALRKDIKETCEAWGVLVANGIDANQAARAVGLALGDVPGQNAPTSAAAGATAKPPTPQLTRAELEAQRNAGGKGLWPQYVRENTVELSEALGEIKGRSWRVAKPTEPPPPPVDAEREKMAHQFEQAMTEFRSAMESSPVEGGEDVDRAAVALLGEIKGILLAGGQASGIQVNGAKLQVPNMVFNVEPTPVTIENKQEAQAAPVLPQPIYNFSPTFAPNVEPAPVPQTVMNFSPTFAPNVEPAAVTVENVNNNNVFPPTQPVTLQVANTTSVVRYDAKGRIVEIENVPEVVANG